MRILRTGILLILLSVLLVLAGGAMGGQSGLKIALGLAVLINGISYFFSDRIALASSGAQRVSREQVPRLYVIPEPAPNAFATGRNPQHASVAVTQGLLELMNDEELEGVIAHELSHVRNYDILTSSIAATIAGAITFLAEMARWGMLFGGFGRDRCTDGRPALWLDQRARKVGSLQPTPSEHLAFPIDLGVVYHKTALRRGRLVLAVQHPSSAGEAHPSSQGDDRRPTARLMRPDSAHLCHSTCNLFKKSSLATASRICNRP